MPGWGAGKLPALLRACRLLVGHGVVPTVEGAEALPAQAPYFQVSWVANGLRKKPGKTGTDAGIGMLRIKNQRLNKLLCWVMNANAWGSLLLAA
eukprot:331909-Chlamydomonas_euryale.AAC.2